MEAAAEGEHGEEAAVGQEVDDSKMEVDADADQSQEIGQKRKRRFRKNADEESAGQEVNDHEMPPVVDAPQATENEN